MTLASMRKAHADVVLQVVRVRILLMAILFRGWRDEKCEPFAQKGTKFVADGEENGMESWLSLNMVFCRAPVSKIEGNACANRNYESHRKLNPETDRPHVDLIELQQDKRQSHSNSQSDHVPSQINRLACFAHRFFRPDSSRSFAVA